MGQSASSQPPVGLSNATADIDNVASHSQREYLINIDGIPSIDFGLDDGFSYEHYDIPYLNGRNIWTFKVIMEGSPSPRVELRLTSDLNNVTAISYAWGEVLREVPVSLGTYVESSESGLRFRGTCCIKLGLEWDLKNFLATLAELSKTSWLWMDQIAKQPGTSTADVIATFATIYSRCPVVVLLPGADCSTCRELSVRCFESGDITYHLAKECVELLTKHYTHCAVYSRTSKGRWFERVWTRQEAMYARRIRIVHVGGDETIGCVLLVDEPDDAMIEAGAAAAQIMINTGEVLGTKMNLPNVIDHSSGVRIAQGIIAQVAFFLGIQLVNLNSKISLSRSLIRLAETNRRTTDPKDLILSVWPGIDTSRYPNIWMSWDSACKEVARHYQDTFGLVLPQGIPLGATSPSPTNSLGPCPISIAVRKHPSVRSLYSPFQLSQAGVERKDDGICRLQVSPQTVIVRPYPYSNNSKDNIRTLAAAFHRSHPWVMRTWRRTLQNACMDDEAEHLSSCTLEAELLFHVLSAQENWEREHPGAVLVTTELEQQYGERSIDGRIFAGLLVMCLTGAWGRRPSDLAGFAGIALIGRREERVCAGKSGTYRLGFGKGTGDMFAVQFTHEENGPSMRQQGNVVIRAVIPFPYHVSQFGGVQSLWRDSPRFYTVL